MWYMTGVAITFGIIGILFLISTFLTGFYHLYFWIHREKPNYSTVTEIIYSKFGWYTDNNDRELIWILSTMSPSIWPLILILLIILPIAFYLRHLHDKKTKDNKDTGFKLEKKEKRYE